jgi:hypothetical protein
MKFRTYIILCTLVFAIGGGLGFVWPTIAQTLQQEPQQPQDPNQDPNQDERTKRYVPGPKKLQPQNIILSYQPDMPMELTAIKEEFADGRDTIRVTLTNTSAKNIRAEGIKILAYDKLDSTNRSFYMFSLAHRPSPGTFLRPGAVIEQVLSESFLEGEKVLIVIDFIEFEDGQLWGPNSEGYFDTIKGQRAGMVAALEKLISMVNQQGAEVLSKEQQLNISIPNPESRSKRWKEGFERGVRSIQTNHQITNYDNNFSKAKNGLFTVYSTLKPLVEQDNEQQ